MLEFILLNMLFDKCKSYGSKIIPTPPKWLIEETLKRSKKRKK